MQSRRAVQTQAATELFQVADTAGFISGTAATMFAMTLVVRPPPCCAGDAGDAVLWSAPCWACVAASEPSCPLQGLAIGFVLLRVEALVEEGKI